MGKVPPTLPVFTGADLARQNSVDRMTRIMANKAFYSG